MAFNTTLYPGISSLSKAVTKVTRPDSESILNGKGVIDDDDDDDEEEEEEEEEEEYGDHG